MDRYQILFELHPETWFASAIPWSAENSEAFAGTHEKRVLIIFDEASAIDDMIWEVASGAMTTPGALWLVFGNPTRNTGRFKECFPGGKFAHRWITRKIDSRTAKKANKEQIEKWIADYGPESDFIKIRVRGEFPSASISQFIGEDLIEGAMNRELIPQAYHSSPVVIGVDVARFGDDASVILIRQGTAILGIRKYREVNTVQLSGYVVEAIKKYNPQAVFIDVIGIGAGVVDQLQATGWNWLITEVNSAENAVKENEFRNLRAEMWGNMKDWLRKGTLPLDDELKMDLMGPDYFFDTKNRLQLESKKDMKARGLASPDIADALALTFAAPVMALDDRRRYEVPEPVKLSDWDVFAH